MLTDNKAEDINRCEICVLIYIYEDQQFKIYENSLNIVFLKQSMKNLIKSLVILRNENPHILCNLINDAFIYNLRKKDAHLIFCLIKKNCNYEHP